jgi:hypothetical protein
MLVCVDSSEHVEVVGADPLSREAMQVVLTQPGRTGVALQRAVVIVRGPVAVIVAA